MAAPVDIDKFYGDNDDATLLDEFVCQLRRAWETQPNLSLERKVDMIIEHSGPDVRAEIRCLEPADRQDPELVLAMLNRVFGETRSPSALLLSLLTTVQHPGETVRRFSYRVRDLFDTLVKRQKTLGEAPTSTSMLRNHFVSGLQNVTLQNFLRERMCEETRRTSEEDELDERF